MGRPARPGLLSQAEHDCRDEILQLIDALQTADAHQVATPANWRPGEAVIMPTPATTEQTSERVAGMAADGYECTDWYLCTKKV